MKLFLAFTWAFISVAFGQQWQNTQYNNGVNIRQIYPTGLWFNVPGPNTNPSGNVNSILRARPGYNLSKHIVIHYIIHRTSGNPYIRGYGPFPVPGGLSPNFRPMLTAGDAISNRWYPAGINCCWLTRPYDVPHTVSIGLSDLSQWQDVNGRPATQNPGQYRSIVQNSGAIVLVFGWMNYFAHGLYIENGTAQLIVQSVTVQ